LTRRRELEAEAAFDHFWRMTPDQRRELTLEEYAVRVDLMQREGRGRG
jgi:hypothetical protein